MGSGAYNTSFQNAKNSGFLAWHVDLGEVGGGERLLNLGALKISEINTLKE